MNSHKDNFMEIHCLSVQYMSIACKYSVTIQLFSGQVTKRGKLASLCFL